MRTIILTDELLDRFAGEFAIRSTFGIPVNQLISFEEYVERRKSEIERELAMAA